MKTCNKDFIKEKELPKGDALSLPKGWEVKKLGEVCDLQNGFAFKSNDYIEFSNTMNFRMSQIRPEGNIDLEKNPKFLPDNYSEKYKDYLLREGDVVIAMTDLATETKILGVPTIMPKDSRSWLQNQRVGRFYKIDYLKINLEFLKYVLSSNQVNEYYKSLGKGGLQINIRKQDILNVKIPLPPLPEQKRIVAILEKAFTAIDQAKANTEKNLKNAREFFQSKLQETFDNGKLKIDTGEWEYGILDDVVKKGSSNISLNKIKDNDGEYSVFGAKGLVKNVSFFQQEQEYLAIIKDGAGIGRVSRHPKKSSVLATMQYLILKEGFDIGFVEYFLNSINFEKHRTGSTIPHIYFKNYKLEQFPIPPLPEQKQMVKKLDAVSTETKKLETIYQRKIICLDELKKSILQKAFNGEL